MPHPPTNNLVTPLLTDFYQITMAYGYFKNNKHNANAVFDLYFRKNPFGAEFTIFGGASECLSLIEHFKITEHDVTYLKTVMPDHIEQEFYDLLLTLDCSQVKVYAIQEGGVVFPSEPLIRIEGPIIVLQILETSLLNLVNFASLVATNAAHHRICAGKNKTLIEFGLRRAQGPDGAISASRYAYLGGFDGTSNVAAGKLFGIPISGTHAHAFVSSFHTNEKLEDPTIKNNLTGETVDFYDLVMKTRDELHFDRTNSSELIAFTAFARAFPNQTLLLVDTYDTLGSGVLNFLVVAYALHKIGYQAKGIRLDSGDLAYLSTQAREMFIALGKKLEIDYFATFNIVASNDINITNLEALNQKGHQINTFGIGTNLVTCQAQPALGCVFKLVELDGIPRIKLSQEISKVTLPGKKDIYRLWSASSSHPIVDLITCDNDDEPKVGDRVLCRHPFTEHKRAFVTVSKVEKLLHLFWDNGKLVRDIPTLYESRSFGIAQLETISADHLSYRNAKPYKVSVSEKLYVQLHTIWLANSPVPEL